MTFKQGCPRELTVAVLTGDKPLRPKLPPNTPLVGALADTVGEAVIEATVRTCPGPDGTPASVEVRFTVKPPGTAGAEAGGHHVHVALRPTGTLRTGSCVVTNFDAQGLGTCTVTYDPSEVSGVETIEAEAAGFQKATAKVTVVVPGLVNLADAPTA